MSSTVRSISYVKSHLAEVIENVCASHDPVVISQSGASTAVIQDHASYSRTRDCLAILKLAAMGEADIEAGRTRSQKKVFTMLRTRLKECED